jgi:hypothetical protein
VVAGVVLQGGVAVIAAAREAEATASRLEAALR